MFQYLGQGFAQSPSKCWFWSICASGRRRLRASVMLEHRVPVKLQARELGADISYCRRKAACERNKRTTSGLGRMSKLHGLPGSVFRKTRLLLAGIFPHALHAAEASYAPKTVLQRLRSGAARAIGCRPTGASPWLACLLASYRCVDPEFVLVSNRIQLFRQLIKELPALSQFFFDASFCTPAGQDLRGYWLPRWMHLVGHMSGMEFLWTSLAECFMCV